MVVKSFRPPQKLLVIVLVLLFGHMVVCVSVFYASFSCIPIDGICHAVVGKVAFSC